MSGEIDNPRVESGRKGASLGATKKWIEIRVSVPAGSPDIPSWADETMIFNDDVRIGETLTS